VTLLAVVEHLRHPATVLRQAGAVLSPGGTVIVTTPHPRARRIHALGARAGLFSRDADEEHETFFDRADLAGLARSAGLTMVYYSTFLVGLNQLAVMQASGRA
jgi:2-polyprenyl-3-methyl-5-hydroxy-6-metoxy-1,4-benzoquinol methylase